MIKVLVIDDSALVRKLLGHVLSNESDFEVFFARNGLEGLDLLDKIKPDVVTLDIYMPQMDGLACLNRIMIERPCPVVMVSSLSREGAETTLEALRLGAWISWRSRKSPFRCKWKCLRRNLSPRCVRRQLPS